VSPVLWVVLGVLAAIASSVVLRQMSQRRLRESLRADWGAPVDRERDMTAISSYHFAMAGADTAAPALDDRTWADLNMDEIFAVLDRTHSSIGQQALYRRLRAAPQAPHLAAFECVADRIGRDPVARERVQVGLAKLSDKAGYDLFLLAQPHILKTEPWFILFPIVAAMMVAALVLAVFWTPALIIVAVGVAIGLATRVVVEPYMRLVIGPFRQLGPLIAVADQFRSLGIAGAEPIVGHLERDVARLARLRRVASWVSRDASSGADLASIALEYLNTIFLFDANAAYFGGRDLRERSAELLRVIDAVGDIDAAVSVASFRAGSADWTRPVVLPSGRPATLCDVRHLLVPGAVPNSIVLAPPHGVIITGSNMSGKSTFLRTVGTTMVMAQTINTCAASRYEAPPFMVRSCIGRNDDIVAGKSYYIVEVESVLGLVRASETTLAHLFLFDELFRGTNAVERIAAGEAVLAQIALPRDGGATPHVVIAATHDHELVDLLRDTHAPYHFTDTVGPEGLTFEYRLESGPATTRNAITLLELNGAPRELVERALRRAAVLDDARRDAFLASPAGARQTNLRH